MFYRWLVKGCCSYIPDLRVEMAEEVSEAHCMDKDEGVYVQDILTGVVRLVALKICLIIVIY